MAIDAFAIGGLIWLSYTIVGLNTIAISRTNYRLTILTSGLFMTVNFFLIRHVAEARSWKEFARYFIGGILGDVTSIWIGKRVAP